MEFFGNGFQLRLFLLLLMTACHRADTTQGEELPANATSEDIGSSEPEPYPYSHMDEVYFSVSGEYDDYPGIIYTWLNNLHDSLLRLQVTDVNRYPGPAKVAVFNRCMLNKFRECLCNPMVTRCCAEMDVSSNVVSISSENIDLNNHHRLPFVFLCLLRNMSIIECARTVPFTESLLMACDRPATTIFWDPYQHVDIAFIHPGNKSRSCEVPGNNSTTINNIGNGIGINNVGTTDAVQTSTDANMNTSSEVENDNDSDLNLIIGIIVACVVVIIFVIVIITFCVIKQRQKSKSSSSTSSARSSDSANNVKRGQDLNSKKNSNGNQQISGKRQRGSRHTSSTRAAAGGSSLGDRSSTTIAKDGSMYNIYTTHGNNASRTGRSNYDPNTPGESVYASIDDAVGMRNEYTSLDESTKYGHLYKGFFTTDPKLRPPLPLPSHITNQPLPYYSLAQHSAVDSSNRNYDYSGSSNQNCEAVSTQYLELFDENATPNVSISGADYLVPISIFSLPNDNESSSYVDLISTNEIQQNNQF